MRSGTRRSGAPSHLLTTRTSRRFVTASPTAHRPGSGPSSPTATSTSVPYNGPNSRWYQAATSQKRGRVRIAGTEVTFAPADDTVLDAVDDAYRTQYAASPYLEPMLRTGPRSATVRITPAA
jgi:hypothetical protein